LYDILDTLPEAEYDDIATLASEICQTPIALISLIDANRQWFKSKIGLDIAETARDISFCTHAINGANIFEVKNPVEDPEFANNPLVTGFPYIRYYAGAPLITKEGDALGTLCVIDTQPHELNDNQKRSLKILSRSVMALLELRYKNKQADFFRRALDEIAAVAVLDERHDYEYANAKFCELAGMSEHDIVGRNYEEVSLADMSENSRQKIRERIRRGEIYKDVIKNINKRGDVSWSNLTLIPYLNHHGDFIKSVSIRVDVTQQVQTIELLQSAEKLARTGSWELNLLNRKRYWSKGLYHLMGFRENEMTENVPTLIDFMAPEQQTIIQKSLNDIFDGKSREFINEVEVFTKENVCRVFSVFGVVTNLWFQLALFNNTLLLL